MKRSFYLPTLSTTTTTMTMSVAPLPAPFKKLGAWAETLDAKKVLFGWDVGWTQRLADGAPLASARGSPAAPLPRGKPPEVSFLSKRPVSSAASLLDLPSKMIEDVTSVWCSHLEWLSNYQAPITPTSTRSTPRPRQRSPHFLLRRQRATIWNRKIRSIALISWA